MGTSQKRECTGFVCIVPSLLPGHYLKSETASAQKAKGDYDQLTLPAKLAVCLARLMLKTLPGAARNALPTGQQAAENAPLRCGWASLVCCGVVRDGET